MKYMYVLWSDLSVKPSDLRVLENDLYPLVAEWRHLGRELKIKEYELDKITTPERNQDKLIEVLKEWMRQKGDEATLSCLCHALKSPVVGHKQLAIEIAKDKAVIEMLMPQTTCML